MRREMSLSLKMVAPLKFNHDVVVPKGRIPQLFALVDAAAAASSGCAFRRFGHAATATSTSTSWSIPATPDEVARAHGGRARRCSRAWSRSKARSAASTASASRRRRSCRSSSSADEIALMKRVKQAFDPNGILNPGKIFADSAGDRGSRPGSRCASFDRGPGSEPEPTDCARRPATARHRMLSLHFHAHSPPRPDFRPARLHVPGLQPARGTEPRRRPRRCSKEIEALKAQQAEMQKSLDEIREFLKAATGGRFGAPSLVNRTFDISGLPTNGTANGAESRSSKCRTITVRSAAATCSRRSRSIYSELRRTPARFVTCSCTIRSRSCTPTRTGRTKRRLRQRSGQVLGAAHQAVRDAAEDRRAAHGLARRRRPRRHGVPRRAWNRASTRKEVAGERRAHLEAERRAARRCSSLGRTVRRSKVTIAKVVEGAQPFEAFKTRGRRGPRRASSQRVASQRPQAPRPGQERRRRDLPVERRRPTGRESPSRSPGTRRRGVSR